MNTLPSMQAEGDGVRLRRWATLAGLLLIVFIIAADVHEAWQSYRDVRGQNERVQLAMSRILAEQAARMVQELDVVLANYASWQTSAEGRVADESAMRARLQADVLRLPFVYSAEVTGTDGRVRAATQSDAKDSASLEKRQAFIVPESAQDNALYIGRPFTGRRDGERTFVLSRRINAANGGFAGVVVAVANRSSGGPNRFAPGAPRPGHERSMTVVRMPGSRRPLRTRPLR